MTTSSFNPDPATTDAILQSIAAEYSLSLTDIAAQHNTSIEALTAWLTRDDIEERLTAIESACARRARLTAANHLPAVAHVAKQALEEASDVLRLPPDYRTQRSIALRIRATESARRAAALLLRIANFTPGPRRVRHHTAPTQTAQPVTAQPDIAPPKTAQPDIAQPHTAQNDPAQPLAAQHTAPCHVALPVTAQSVAAQPVAALNDQSQYPEAPRGHITSGHITSGHITSGHITPGHITPGHITPGHITSGHVTPGHATPGDITHDEFHARPGTSYRSRRSRPPPAHGSTSPSVRPIPAAPSVPGASAL